MCYDKLFEVFEKQFFGDIPERTLDEPDPHVHDESPGEYEHEDEPETHDDDDELHHISCKCWQCNTKAIEMEKTDPIESGVDLTETLWLIGTGKTLKEWTK